MKKILLLFFYFSFHILYAQNLDSLKVASKNAKPVEKVKTLISISNIYFYSKPDSAIHYLNEALKISEKFKLNKEKISILVNIGIFYNENGNLTQAKKILLTALETATELKDTSKMIVIYGNLGNNSMLRGDFDNSLNYLTQTANMYEKNGNIKGVAYSYGAIGNMYNQMNKPKKAIKYYELAKTKFEEIKDTVSIALIKMNSGIIAYKLKNYSKAEDYLVSAYNIFKEKDILLNAGKCLQSLSIMYKLKNETEKSIKYSKKALTIFEKVNSNIDIAGVLQNLASCYIDDKHYNKSISLLKRAYDIDEKEKNYYHLEKVSLTLKNCYDSLHDYKNAYRYANKHKIFHDSVYNIKTTEKFSELEIKYETSKKEQQIEILEKNKEILEGKEQRNFWIIIGLIAIFLMSAIIFLLIHNRQKLKSLQKATEVEQKLLRLQMNPHFIFNAIYAIQNFMLENDTQKSSIYLSNFAKLMRLILENSRKTYISIDEEVKMLEYYIQFQQLRHENSFDFNIEISENIDSENTLIPPMLIQPFIENAIKHGFSSEIKNAFIKIVFKLKNNFIFVTIEDNGKGINNTKNSTSKHHSLATKITKERLQLILNKKDQKQIELNIIDLKTIDTNKTGTQVSFQVPFVEEF